MRYASLSDMAITTAIKMVGHVSLNTSRKIFFSIVSLSFLLIVYVRGGMD